MRGGSDGQAKRRCTLYPFRNSSLMTMPVIVFSSFLKPCLLILPHLIMSRLFWTRNGNYSCKKKWMSFLLVCGNW